MSSYSKAEQSWLLSVTLHLELRKPSSMSFNWLRHLPVYWVQLHGSDNTVLLKKRGHPQVRPRLSVIYTALSFICFIYSLTPTLPAVIYLCWNTDEQQPLLFGIGAVVDDLTACKTGVTVKHFDWLRITLHAPVVDCVVCDEGNSVEGDPLPEGHVIRHCVGLHLALHLNVEDLQSLCRWKYSHLKLTYSDKVNDLTPLPQLF